MRHESLYFISQCFILASTNKWQHQKGFLAWNMFGLEYKFSEAHRKAVVNKGPLEFNKAHSMIVI